ncbi:hypothetical protein F0241_13175 [Vibrio kanaloae]|uniref:hypothetical protein n=1 Tax=Vibrio kanaloae TaxID=170673 RepID=UPI00148C843D|nr:hypothetical protein [Vibrio kanaloae]NOI02046.1 hypothetical protein [Vibrio kanaloae]
MNNISFLFTVLLSVLAWTTNQIVSDLEKQPILEVTDIQYDVASNELTYLLSNISNNKLFKQLTFEVYGGITSCSHNHDVVLGPPNMKSEETKPPRCNGLEAVEFSVEEFHPNSSVKLKANIEFGQSENTSALYVKSSEAVKVVPRSFQTYLVKNKLQILMVLFTIWLILIVLYLLCIRRNWFNASS